MRAGDGIEPALPAWESKGNRPSAALTCASDCPRVTSIDLFTLASCTPLARTRPADLLVYGFTATGNLGGKRSPERRAGHGPSIGSRAATIAADYGGQQPHTAIALSVHRAVAPLTWVDLSHTG